MATRQRGHDVQNADPTAIRERARWRVAIPRGSTCPNRLYLLPSRAGFLAALSRSRSPRGTSIVRHNIFFSGDLDDPWVRGLRDVLPGEARVIESRQLPDPAASPPASVLVLHRPNLTMAEAVQLRAIRNVEPPPRVVLVLGGHVRCHHLMSWDGLADVVLNEATAASVIGRHLKEQGAPRPIPRRCPRVDVACDGHALRELLAEVLETAGYRVGRARTLETVDAPWVVWDVPCLEPDWTDRLAAVAQRRGVVALIALADRELVGNARRHGAIACLDLPCDPDDLVYVMDRLTTAAHGPHALRLDRHGRSGARSLQ